MNNHGKRNLIILGVGAILIAGISTSISLWAYRSSGDIYLDRSRPGYLPEKDEVNEDSNTSNTYNFNETGGELTKSELETYLKELKTINNRIKAIPNPYAPDPLSDESLGIPTVDEPEDKN